MAYILICWGGWVFKRAAVVITVNTRGSDATALKAGREQCAMTSTNTSETETTPASLKGGELIRAVGFWRIVAEDFRRHDKRLLAPGFQALAVYRFGTWADGVRFKPFRWPLSAIYLVAERFVRNVYGIEMRRTVKAGRRLLLAHQHGIVIHALAEIGDDVTIRHNVTFGAGVEWTWSGPKIGDRVSVSPGVVVVGDVSIGDDVSIGPNCTVTTNVPSGRTLFVPPPRSIPNAAAQDAAPETPAEDRR